MTSTKTGADFHPAFLEAEPKHRWRGDTLKALWKFLERNAESQSPQWVGVILPHGARVALKQPAEGPRVLRIYRRERFTVADGEARWLAEISTFAREFGVLGWEKDHRTTMEGGPLTEFKERAQPLDFFRES